VSVNNDGSLFVAGWGVYTSRLGLFAYQFGDATGSLNIDRTSSIPPPV